MRASLASLRGERCHFSATFAGRSKFGHIILSNVSGPIGNWQHLWIPESEWQTFLPRPGTHVELVARVGTYERARDNTIDFGLFDCREVNE
jgi:hypothetical protein